MKNRIIMIFILMALSALAYGCASSSDGTDYSEFIKIDQPSADDPVLAEKRDFYIIGWFEEQLDKPGDIKIELFKGTETEGAPIRVVTSCVDQTTFTTSPSDIYLDYEYGNNFSNSSGATLEVVPDVVINPGGLLNATNKCVVTKDYYAALIYGGVTKDFDISYVDDEGEAYQDLTYGTYTVKVTGLSGKLNGYTDQKIINFGLTHISLGRFSPSSALSRLTEFAEDNGYTILLDNLPGYFSYKGMTYEIRNRLFPNNSIEVVNYLPGTVVDNPQNAINNILIYNINKSCATETVETAALVKYSLMDSNQTTVNYYDIGEPGITYYDFEGNKIQLNGTIIDFEQGDFLEWTRAEIGDYNGTLDDNYYIDNSTTPKELDTDLTDGIYIGSHDKIAMFGVVKQMTSDLTPS